ncbi:uncharacterized protein LOC121745707 [Salvia splendens]|uniref:uncharacterized protein LOC121745707 n=1 Tax=Salvia splendens TaxID=180675 RepID=UPI001C25A0CD|nr:uncharacterized protein LOC121745707 [Salvia splendens]
MTIAAPTLESDQDLITVLRYRRIHAQTPPLCDAYTNPNNVLALDQGSCSSSDGSHISHQSFSFQGIDDHHQNLFFNDAGTSTSSSNYACFNDNPQDYYSSIEEIKELITINDGSGLSQIREDVQEEHTPKAAEDREDGGRHPYTQAETMTLFDAWIGTSNDPILGNQQTRKYFWDKVTNVYNAKKPTGAFSRNMKMLRAHFERADRDVKIFCGIYKREAEQYQSGASGSDMLRAALHVFKSDTGKDFKFPNGAPPVHTSAARVQGGEGG